MAWLQGIELEPMEASKNVISCFVRYEPSLTQWLLTAVHGPPHAAERNAFWKEFQQIPQRWNLLWLIVEDMNSTLKAFEKRIMMRNIRTSRLS